MESYLSTHIASNSYPKDIVDSIIDYSKTLDNMKLARIVSKLNEGNTTDLYTGLILMRMIANENPEMLSTLGDRYYSGNCVRKDEQKALQLFEEAANNGSVRSKYDLAWYYYDRKEYMRAAEYFKSCIDFQNDLESYMVGKSYACLGNCYVSISEPKYSQGFEYLSIAADKYHDNFACRKLGFLYSETESNYFNAGKSVQYLERASKNGDVIAARELGSYYLFGNESLRISKNGQKAESVLLPYKDSEDADLLRYLGILYLNGDKNSNFSENIEKACTFYEKARNLSNDGRIAADLGYAYYKLNRYKDAEELLLIADGSGYCYYSDFLGRMYKDGDLGYKDLSKALTYYEKAFSSDCINNVFTCAEYSELLVELGNFQKAYEVAVFGEKTYNDIWFIYIKADLLLSQRVRNEISLDEAAEMMELCIKYDTHSAEAHMALGHYYLATRNYRMAEKHYLDAFNLGVADAGVFLGRLYENGGGTINPNSNMAYEWFAKAANKGSALGNQEVQCWKKGLLGGYRRIRRLV